MGGNVLQSVYHETKQVTSACWACPVGSKVAVGYSNGEILIWGVPSILNLKTEECGTQSTPICKLNLGYKLDKIPISSLKWVYADGKASRLYIMGASDFVSMNLLQVLSLSMLNKLPLRYICFCSSETRWLTAYWFMNFLRNFPIPTSCLTLFRKNFPWAFCFPQ